MRCPKCHNEFSYALERCPHCAHPGNYSNVHAASEASERALVDERYQAALREADRKGTRAALGVFETWIDDCCVVVSRSLDAIEQLAKTDRTVYASYYELTQAGLRLPDGSQWDTLRGPADEVLFPHYKAKIRFGALSGDGVGVLNYGSFSLGLRTSYIHERATIFDGNSAAFVIEHKIKDAPAALRGHRAPWSDRAKLMVAQLSDHIRADITAAEFPAVLIEQGATTDHDRFIEAHVWGSITVRTVEKVVYLQSRSERGATKSRLKMLARALERFEAQLEVRP